MPLIHKSNINHETPPKPRRLKASDPNEVPCSKSCRLLEAGRVEPLAKVDGEFSLENEFAWNLFQSP